MKIDIALSGKYIDKEKIKGKNVVVIDVLRATSVIVTALYNGASSVIPILSCEEAFELKKSNRNLLLGGERNAVKIEGFDLSNSPLEYKSETVHNKDIVLTTTNGTNAIINSLNGENIFIASFLNAEYVCKKIISFNNDLLIVNAGLYGDFSLEDFMLSGFLIHLLKLENLMLSDLALTALNLYELNGEDFCKNSSHYKNLIKLGYNDDLKYCFNKNIIDIVPEYDKELKKIILPMEES